MLPLSSGSVLWLGQQGELQPKVRGLRQEVTWQPATRRRTSASPSWRVAVLWPHLKPQAIMTGRPAKRRNVCCIQPNIQLDGRHTVSLTSVLSVSFRSESTSKVYLLSCYKSYNSFLELFHTTCFKNCFFCQIIWDFGIFFLYLFSPL